MSVFKLSRPRLEALIRSRSADVSRVVFTRHAEMRMKQRRILRAEVLEVLRRGNLRRPAEPNAALGTLECRMQRFVAGREVAAVVAVADDEPDVVVITAMVIGG